MKTYYMIIGALMTSLAACSLTACGKHLTAPSSTTVIKKEETKILDRDKLDMDHLSVEELEELCNTYQIPGDMPAYNTYTFDRAGKRIGDWDIHVKKLSDAVTGETAFYSAYYREYEEHEGEENREDGYAYHCFSRLYSMNGQVLIDWTEVDYTDAVGNWVLAQVRPPFYDEDYLDKLDTKLLNVITGEEQEDVMYIRKGGNCLYTESKNGDMVTILLDDGSGSQQIPLPDDNECIDTLDVVADRYLVGVREKNGRYQVSFFDQTYGRLGTIPKAKDSYVDADGIKAPYVRCGNGIYDPTEYLRDVNKLKPVYKAAYVSYYDGQLAVSRNKNSHGKFALYDAKTKAALTDYYQQLEYGANQNDLCLTDEAAYFVGIDGHRIDKIDRNGQVIASVNADCNLYIAWVCASGIVVYDEDYSKCALYDNDLKELIPMGKYTYISPAIDNWEQPDRSVWSAGYDLYEGESRLDLLKSDGAVLLHGISDYAYNGEEYIGVSRGKKIGLIDLDGNWLLQLDKISFIPVSSDTSKEEGRKEPAIKIEGFDADRVPRLDGSLANEPMIYRLFKDITGFDQDSAEVYLANSFQNGGTSTCWLRLAWDEIDLAISYEMPDDTRENMEEYMDDIEVDPLGKDGLVFIVNKDNPIESLTVEQIHDIYTGKIRDWSEVGGEPGEIKAFQRNATSGSQTLLNKLVMDGDKTMQPEEDALIGTMGELIKQVAEFDGSGGALGFSVYYYADRMKSDPNLKMIRIDGVEPSNETIADGSYPLANDFYLAIRKDQPQNSPVRRLKNWLLSEEGKKLLVEEGYVPADN